MKYRKTGGVYVIKLKKGEKVIEQLSDFLEKEKISCAHFSGVGAVQKAEVGFYNLGSKAYAWETIEDAEVLSMNGNVSLLDGKSFVHAHVVLSDKSFNARGGHLKEAVVGATVEIVLEKMPLKLKRKIDKEIGLNLLDM